MPKRKRYNDLSRSQQWRRQQNIDCAVHAIDTGDTNNINIEIEIPDEMSNDNILIEKNSNDYLDNNKYMYGDVEECSRRIDSYSNCSCSESDMELIAEYNNQCYKDLNFNVQKELALQQFIRT